MKICVVLACSPTKKFELQRRIPVRFVNDGDGRFETAYVVRLIFWIVLRKTTNRLEVTRSPTSHQIFQNLLVEARYVLFSRKTTMQSLQCFTNGVEVKDKFNNYWRPALPWIPVNQIDIVRSKCHAEPKGRTLSNENSRYTSVQITGPDRTSIGIAPIDSVY